MERKNNALEKVKGPIMYLKFQTSGISPHLTWSHINVEGDNPPVGIILTRHKDEIMVEYATYGMESRLFMSRYQLYLPNREELQRAMNYRLREVGDE